MTRVLLPKALWQGLALMLLPSLALLGIETYQISHIVPELRQNQELVGHTINVITTAQSLERALQDAERGQRGFLITGKEEYLEPYRSGVQQVSILFLALRKLTSDNPEQQRRWPDLEHQIDIKLAELKRSIEVRQTQGFDTARGIVETNVGLESMRAIDELLDAVIATETNLLKERQATGEAAERRAAIASTIALAIAVALLGTGGALLTIGSRRLLRSERDLHASESRFRLMVSGIKDYALFMLDPDGRVISWNLGAERMKGYSPEEIIGRHFSCFYPSEDIEAGEPQRLIQTALTNGSVSAEGWRVRKDGSRFWASVLLTAIRDDRGSLQGYAKLTRDITERVEAEAALARERDERERAEQMLRQVEKLDVLGQLTGGIAHDFNNMLGVITGNLEILQMRLGSRDAKIADPIRHAMEAADRSAVLTQQLLAFSRRQPLAPTAVDVNRLVSGMSNLLHRTLGESIAIETVLAAGLWPALADVNQLENALLNLALNARDAMPDGGKLTIETGNVYLDEAYAAAHAEVMEGQYVMLAVTDTGTGMSRELIDKAFEPFFTTKPSGQGTGLGLSQVYGFVKQSAGHIKIYSEVALGTTVKLYVPRSTGDGLGALAPGDAPAASPQQHPGTILVVEDNELLSISTRQMLQQYGYRVLAAADGTAALRILERERDVRLLFTDVGLPGPLNGRQLAEEAQRRRPDVKVLFTTGYARNAIIHQGRLDPGVEFIAKPFTYAALIAKIARVMGEEVA